MGVGYILLAAIAVVTVVVTIGAVWAYIYLQPILADQKLHAEMIRLQAAAQIYYAKIETYRGVCRDIGVRPSYVCRESDNSFAVTIERPNGTYYCIDNSGHFDEQVLPLRTEPKCYR